MAPTVMGHGMLVLGSPRRGGWIRSSGGTVRPARGLAALAFLAPICLTRTRCLPLPMVNVNVCVFGHGVCCCPY